MVRFIEATELAQVNLYQVGKKHLEWYFDPGLLSNEHSVWFYGYGFMLQSPYIKAKMYCSSYQVLFLLILHQNSSFLILI